MTYLVDGIEKKTKINQSDDYDRLRLSCELNKVLVPAESFNAACYFCSGIHTDSV